MALIDRDGERRLVESFLDDAGLGRRALFLHGEAGIGKTAIWQWALDAAAGRGHRVLVTRPTEAEARLPFAGLNDLFGDMVDAIGPELPSPQRAALDVALMRSSAGGEPMQPLALALAVLELVRLASAKQPVTVAIDDVQWLDPSSAGVLRFALRRLEMEPVIVVATERTDAAPAAPAILADLPGDRVVRVPVTSLGAEEIDRLLDESLDLQLSPTMLRRVHRLSGGNPFYALEIGRSVSAGGIDLESLGGLVRARLAALSSDAREVAAHAAALAQPSAAVLEAALGPERAISGIADAREADVLAPGDNPIRFTHPLLAAEVYGALDDENRRGLHRRLAAVVAEPEELARHLALAATGPDPAVAEALDAAATHAAGRGALDAGAELSEMAAGLTPDADVARSHRMASAGRYRLMAGDAGRAREILERALGDSGAKRGPARAELLYRLAMVRQLTDDFAASGALGREALEHAGDDRRLTVQIKLLLAGVSFITGREWSSGAQHAFEAKELAEQLDDPRMLAATLGPYASWRYATGHGYDPELAQRAAELEPWTSRFRTLDLPEFDIAGIESLEGQTASAQARMAKLLERAERDGDYSSLPFLLGNMTSADFLHGRGGVARERIERATRLSHTTGQRTAQVHSLVCEARLEARLGNADRALAAAREAFDLMDATKWRVGEWWLRADVALLELSRGDAEAALQLVSEAVDARATDEPDRHRWGQAVAVEALVALGRLEDAGRALDDLGQHARTHPTPRLQAEILRARARILAARGDVEEADAAIAEAQAIYRRIEDPWELARTLLVAGEVHRRARRRAKARTALREAIETFTFLGAGMWANTARDQLARIGAHREADGLTPTQRSVAELVVGGLTNRQVANRLSMSAHTVEAHLTAIYRSLGIRSRTDLRAALGDPRDSAGIPRDSARS
ncbi:MAG: AAA family ATPase [Candidatus Limnocylindria bacterium]